MANTSQQLRTQFNSFFGRLNLRQKMMLFGGIVTSLALIMIVFVWTARPNYEVLFANLSQKDAGRIIENLKEKQTQYKLENGGTTVMVPTDQVYELRIAFAQDGLPESSGVGYEIFDKTNLGMTDFIQQVNFRRALEGELARTIEQINSVERARVHIVIPRETLFKEDEKETTASVILKLNGAGAPSKGTVYGIVHLISSSVEGLTPENITVVDTRGRVLSDTQDPNNMLSMSATQLEFNKKVENYLSQKAQSMLDQVVGPGNSVVRVTADLNFTQVEKSIEQYDPDNTVVRSEEIDEESTPVGSGDAAAAGGQNPAAKHSVTVTNYEINKTVQRVVEGMGNIKRLSVAVMVNNKRTVTQNDDGEKQVEYTTRNGEEMQMLGNLVKTAVGFQQQRGDQVSVVNVDFSMPSLEDEMLETDAPKFWDNWYNVIEKVFLLLAVISSMLIMKSLFSHVKKRNDEIKTQMRELVQHRFNELPGKSRERALQTPGEQEEENENEVVMAEDFFRSIERRDPLSKNLQLFIKEKPEEAARLLKVWLAEDDRQRYE